MERFLNDEEMYVSFLPQVVDEPAFVRLGLALQRDDAKAAFEEAHMLKGVLGNMGLTPMYEVTCKIVEPVRRGETQGVEYDYEKLLLLKDELASLIAK